MLSRRVKLGKSLRDFTLKKQLNSLSKRFENALKNLRRVVIFFKKIAIKVIFEIHFATSKRIFMSQNMHFLVMLWSFRIFCQIFRI